MVGLEDGKWKIEVDVAVNNFGFGGAAVRLGGGSLSEPSGTFVSPAKPISEAALNERNFIPTSCLQAF